MAQCKRYLHHSIQDLKEGNLPPRVLVSIDMENMFNNMSRAQCQGIIQKKFSHLISIFNSIYQKGSIIYYQTGNGKIHTIVHKEGIAQGCPWSTTLSTILLGEVIIELSKAIKQRILQYPSTDPNDDGYSEPIAFVDNKYIFVQLKDVLWLFCTTALIGRKYSCYPKIAKNKIMTNIVDISILPYIQNPSIKSTLKTATEQYTTDGEESHGVVALGVPIGSPTFVNASLQTFTDALEVDTKITADNFTTLQLFGQIYTTCLLSRSPFRMLADVATNASLDTNYTVTPWSSFTSRAIEKTSKYVLQHLLQRSHLPPHAYALATLPESKMVWVS
eukprot:69128-Ditylum_brightwellii.AAC.1